MKTKNTQRLYVISTVSIFIGLVSCNLLPMDETSYFERQNDIISVSMSPSEREVIRTDRPHFSWNVSAEILHSDFQLSSSENFETALIIDLSKLEVQDHALNEALTIGGRYYWRIRYTTAEGNTSHGMKGVSIS